VSLRFYPLIQKSFLQKFFLQNFFPRFFDLCFEKKLHLKHFYFFHLLIFSFDFFFQAIFIQRTNNEPQPSDQGKHWLEKNQERDIQRDERNKSQYRVFIKWRVTSGEWRVKRRLQGRNPT